MKILRSFFLRAALILFLAALSASLARAQSVSWTQQAPIPTGADLYAVQMLSATEAWAVGLPNVVIHTSDGGLHWQSTALNTNSLAALFFVDSQHGWAAGNGFFHTTNGGQSWVQDNTWGSIYELFFIDMLHGWACGNGGVTYRTTDGGLHWSFKAVGPISTLSSIFFVDTLHGWTLNIDGQIYKTSDSGQSWTLQWDTSGQYLSTLQFFDAQEGWAIGGDTFLHTLNGGQNWVQASAPPGTWSHGANFSDRMHGVSVGEYGNITLTLDGGQSWTTIQPIGVGPRLWDVHFVNASRGMYCGETGVLQITLDGGQSWASLQSGGTGSTHALDAVDALHAWAANEGGEVLHTVDGGDHWERSFVAGFDIYGNIKDIDFLDTSLGWAVGRHEFFGGGTGKIVRSDDGGKSWQVQHAVDDAYFEAVKVLDAQTVLAVGWIPQGPSQVLRTTNGGQSWINVAPSNARMLSVDFAGPSHGWIVGGLIYASTDGGQSWAHQYTPSELLNSVSFADTQNGWAVGWSGTVLHTSDGGQHWAPQNASPATNVLFAVHALSPTTAWIAGGNGFIARTTNGGLFWQTESVLTDITYPVEALFFLDADHGWAGGRGIWKRETSSTCLTPVPYCTAKANSSGGFAALGGAGVPSSSGGGFAVTVSNALPLRAGLFFYGSSGPASIPFNNGTLCVQPPLVRMHPLLLDAMGTGMQTIPVTSGMAGTTRWYQFLYRDPLQTDGTSVALSNGLEVGFCN